jgi:predicted membrane GTPase involved in stress response
MEGDMTPLFEAIVEQVPPPAVDPRAAADADLALDYSSYVGAIAVGRISAAAQAESAGGGGQARRRLAQRPIGCR